MTDKPSLWEDLKQRRVVRAVAIYAVVGWGAFQVAESVSPVLGLPEIVPRIVLFVLLLGFPLVAGLAWAFDVDRSGVQRADSSGGRGRMWVAIGGAAVVAGAIGIYTVRTAFEAPGASELDDSLVAVMPFRASVGPDLSYLGDGMVDLIAGRLSHEDAVQAADPASTFAALGAVGGATPDAVVRVAARLGAGRVLTGSIAGVPGGLEIRAELGSSLGGAPVAQTTVRGSVDSLSVLVDQLVVQLLSLEAGELLDRIGVLAGSPPEAIRAYLEGRDLYRSGEYGASVEAFHRAILVDSTFALAGIALNNAANMALAIPQGSASLGARTAWNNRDRLPPADREFLAYMLGGNYPEARTDRERIAAGEEASRRVPDRIEAWYLYADRVYHDHTPLGLENGYETARRAFDRILELDPRHAVALQHRLWIANETGEPREVAAGFAERMLDVSDSPEMRWEAALVLGRDDIASPIEADLASAAPETLLTLDFVQTAPAGPGFGSEKDHLLADRAAEELSRRALSSPSVRTLFVTETMRGRPAFAAAQFEALRRRGDSMGDRWIVLSAVFSRPDQASVRAAGARLEERRFEERDPADNDLTRLRDVCIVELWRLSRGDTGTYDRSLSLLRDLPGEDRGFRMEREGCVLMLDAVHAMIVGATDSAARVDTLERWMLEGAPMYSALESGLHLLVGRMRRELGDLEGARAALERCCRAHPNNVAWIVDTRLELAEIALALGDRDTAIVAFDYYVSVREAAEPSVQESVDYARRELARLVAGE